MSSTEEKMADMENSYVLDSPANILRYGAVEKISMQLSIIGTLVNWKNVADKLGFSNLEISGHYSNFNGSEAALNMLNDWIFKNNGKIRDLVRVFLSLELHSCIEDLKEELENYQHELKTVQEIAECKDGRISLDNEVLLHPNFVKSADSLTTSGNNSGLRSYQTAYTSDCSKGFDSCSTTLPDLSLQSDNSSVKMSMQSDNSVDSLPCPIPLLQGRAWPEPPGYQRSTSVPDENRNQVKPKKTSLHKFQRSKSVEAETKTHKKKTFLSRLRKETTKKNKPTKSGIVKGKTNTVEENSGNTSTTAEAYYKEDVSTLKPNSSPLKIAEEKTQRPGSSTGSDDSIPCSPSSPSSPGYESGYHSGDNSVKQIYIVCNPNEEVVFQLALKMYLCFSKKGYKCHMFATDPKEMMEIGRFRYEMQQVKDADFVFLCVSKKLKEIFEVPLSKVQSFKDDDTKGLRHVSDFMMTFFANDCCNKNGKFMTILLAKDSYDHVPFVMKSYLKYNWPEQEKRMENTIHQRSSIPLHPVSNAKVYPPIKVCTPKGVVKASVKEDDTQG